MFNRRKSRLSMADFAPKPEQLQQQPDLIIKDELIMFLPLYFAGSFAQFGFDMDKFMNS